MVSFDVTFLYTNISLIDTLNIIKNYVNNNDQFNRKTAIPKDKFLDLVHLVLTNTRYTFNSQFFQHTDGVAMAGPASSTTVEIYVQAYERTASTTLHPPKVGNDLMTLMTYAFGKLFPSYQQSSSKY